MLSELQSWSLPVGKYHNIAKGLDPGLALEVINAPNLEDMGQLIKRPAGFFME